MKQKISARQAGVLISISIISSKIICLPSVLFPAIQVDGVFIYFLFAGLELLALWGFLTLKKKFPNSSFKSILEAYLGKVFTKIIFAIIMCVFMVDALLFVNEIYTYCRDFIYEEAPMYLFLVCVFPVIGFAVSTGLRPIARTAEFYYKFIAFGVLLCIIIAFFKIKTPPAFFANGFGGKLAKAGVKHLFWALDMLFIFLIMDKVDYSKELVKKTFGYTIFSIVIIISLIFCFYALFTVTGFLHGNAIIDIVVLITQYVGIGRVDIVALLTIMFMLFPQFSIVCYCFCLCFKEVFQVKTKPAIGAFMIVFLLLHFLIVKNLERIINFSVMYMGYASLVIWIFFMFYLFMATMLDKKYGRIANEKNTA